MTLKELLVVGSLVTVIGVVSLAIHHSLTSNFEEKPELSLALSERKDDLHSLGVISITVSATT